MKTIKKLNIRELYKQHERAIVCAILAIIAIILFGIGYLINWNFFDKPLSDKELNLAERIIENIDSSKIPEEFYITIKSTDTCKRGKIVVKSQNDELIITQDLDEDEAALRSIFYGITFTVCIFLIIIFLGASYLTYKECKKVKNKSYHKLDF